MKMTKVEKVSATLAIVAIVLFGLAGVAGLIRNVQIPLNSICSTLGIATVCVALGLIGKANAVIHQSVQ